MVCSRRGRDAPEEREPRADRQIEPFHARPGGQLVHEALHAALVDQIGSVQGARSFGERVVEGDEGALGEAREQRLDVEADLLQGVQPVDKEEVDGRPVAQAPGRDELLGRHQGVFRDVRQPRLREGVLRGDRVPPVAIDERGVDEAEAPHPGVAQGRADHERDEAPPRADDHDVFGSKGAGEAVVEPAQAEVTAACVLAVTHRLHGCLRAQASYETAQPGVCAPPGFGPGEQVLERRQRAVAPHSQAPDQVAVAAPVRFPAVGAEGQREGTAGQLQRALVGVAIRVGEVMDRDAITVLQGLGGSDDLCGQLVLTQRAQVTMSVPVGADRVPIPQEPEHALVVDVAPAAEGARVPAVVPADVAGWEKEGRREAAVGQARRGFVGRVRVAVVEGQRERVLRRRKAGQETLGQGVQRHDAIPLVEPVQVSPEQPRVDRQPVARGVGHRVVGKHRHAESAGGGMGRVGGHRIRIPESIRAAEGDRDTPSVCPRRWTRS